MSFDTCTPVYTHLHASFSTVVHVCRTKTDYGLMESRLAAIPAPSAVGRLIRRFQFKMSSLTAQEVMAFVNVYSLVVWRDQLTEAEWPLWLLLVRCSRLLSQHACTREDRTELDALLLRYGVEFQAEYGIRACRPNQHMATHLVHYLRLFGPAHTHWCFGWERHNGQLGTTPTNGHSFELTVMKRYVQRNHVRVLPLVDGDYLLYSEHERKLFDEMSGSCLRSGNRGLVRETGPQVLSRVRTWKSDVTVTGAEPFVGRMLGKPKIREVTEFERDRLERLLLPAVFPGYDVRLQTFVETARRLELGNGATVLGSAPGRYYRSSFVLTWYQAPHGGLWEAWPAQIKYYMYFAVDMSKKEEKESKQASVDTSELKRTGPIARITEPEVQHLWYARVRWFRKWKQDDDVRWKQYRALARNGADVDADGSEHVWYADRDASSDPEFIPVQSVLCPFIPAYDVSSTGDRVFRICSLSQHIHL